MKARFRTSSRFTRNITILTLITALPLVAYAAGGGTPDVAIQTSAYGVHVILLIGFILLSVIVSFVCSVSEAVLLTMTPSYVASIAEENPSKSDMLKDVKIDKIDQSIAAILTLNTISHTVGSLGAGAQATIVFGNEWFGIFSAAMTLVILIGSEIIPKTIGTLYWRQLSGPVAYFVKAIIFVLYPLIWFSERITKLLTKGKKAHTFSRNEFAALASVGEQSGQIDPLESRIIRNLLAFGAIKVEDIMTPRSVMHAFDQSITVAELLANRPKLMFSRLPIYDEDLDKVTGFVLKSDILLAKANNHMDKPLESYKREITFVFSKMKLFDLLDLMLNSRIHIAITVGEYGEVKGLVTLEDVLETLLGLEIVDEVDRVEDMQVLARQMMQRRSARLGMLVEDENNSNMYSD
ncbi:hemolysin family protein [Psychrobacter sp.]|uniref:CNNM domain-containing protein n=1 Tax=Psychrobacter sp. TaxID=56811 RepID=UPI0025F47192|nr:hemolysin family protein [Psychrobacter sp.]